MFEQTAAFFAQSLRRKAGLHLALLLCYLGASELIRQSYGLFRNPVWGSYEQMLCMFVFFSLVLPVFYIVLCRAILTDRWTSSGQTFAVLRRMPYLRVALWLFIAKLAAQVASIGWAVMMGVLTDQAATGSINWASPEWSGPMSMAFSQLASAAGWVVATCLCIDLPGLATGRPVLRREDFGIWKQILPVAVIFIFGVEIIWGLQLGLQNVLQQVQWRWRVDHNHIDYEFIPRLITFVQVDLFGYVRYALLLGLSAALHGVVWPTAPSTVGSGSH